VRSSVFQAKELSKGQLLGREIGGGGGVGHCVFSGFPPPEGLFLRQATFKINFKCVFLHLI
jgi:hypothetical protein